MEKSAGQRKDMKTTLLNKIAGRAPGVPYATGPYGREAGPGGGRADGSGMTSSQVKQLADTLRRGNFRLSRDPEASSRVYGKPWVFFWNKRAAGKSEGTAMTTDELRRTVSHLKQLHDSSDIMKYKDQFNRSHRDPRYLAGLEDELRARQA